MKQSEKRMIIILGIILVLVLVISLMQKTSKSKEKNEGYKEKIGKMEISSNQQEQLNSVEENGIIVNISEQLKQNKEENGFLISDINLKEENGETVLTARLTNKSGIVQEEFLGNVVLLDRENNEIGRIPIRVSETQNEETIEIEASITESYSNAYDFRIEKQEI